MVREGFCSYLSRNEWGTGNVEMWKCGNVANVASVANTNVQYQLGIGNIDIGNIFTLVTFNSF